MTTERVRLALASLLVLLSCRESLAQNAPAQQTDPLGPGDHTRSLMIGEQERSYVVHVPKGYNPKKPAPVVLALHGAAMNGPMMVWFCGLNKKADEAGFIAVYPTALAGALECGRLQRKDGRRQGRRRGFH